MSESNALRESPTLPTPGTQYDVDEAKKAARPQEFNFTDHRIEDDRGLAGEIGSVYVPAAWRNQRKASKGEDDLFSDVAEFGSDSEDDEQWDAEFARAEEEVAGEGRYAVGYGNAAFPVWSAETAETRSQGVTNDAATESAAAAADPPAARDMKHMPPTGMREWADPAASAPAPSPTESQLVAEGFEFHNELSEEEQIARFGDKAFRKALREVLPSLSRKQQWYAWQKVNKENRGDEGDGEEVVTAGEVLNTVMKEESGECECKCPGNGEECSGDDATCGKLLNDCRCGDCYDCNEHYRWHHPDGACGTEGQLEEEAEHDRMPKCVCGEGVKEEGEQQLVLHEHNCPCCGAIYQTNNSEPKATTSACCCCCCCCGGDEGNCLCPRDGCLCEDCPRSQTRHHRPVLNPKVADRPSVWTGIFSHGGLINGELVSSVREGLDLGHNVPAPTQPCIPGLGLLYQPLDPQPTPETICGSVEPETPHCQMLRESTPAFEDRSPSPSPTSYQGTLEDVEMSDAVLTITPAPQASRLPLPEPTSSPDSVSNPMHAMTAPQTPAQLLSQSPAKAPLAAPDPVHSTPKPAKRGGRRKSAVQGSKVEKTSTTKSRAVSRKVTTAVKNAAENAGGRVKEAVARIEANVKGEQEITPRRSARIRAIVERECTPKE